MGKLEAEEGAEAFGLDAGDGDFGALFVVHAELEARFEPGDHFADAVDVHEPRAVDAPELFGVEAGLELLDGFVGRLAFEGGGDDGDEAVVDGGVDDFVGVDDPVAVVAADEDLGFVTAGGAGEVGLGGVEPGGAGGDGAGCGCRRGGCGGLRRAASRA